MGSTYDDSIQAVRFCLRKIKVESMKPFLLLCLLVMGPAHGKGIFTEGDELLVQTSLWTKHYHPEPDHNNHQKLLNLEYYFNDEVKFFVDPQQTGWRDDIRWLAGGATFKNSYDQQTLYLYGGGRYDFDLSENTKAYAKLTAGLLYGYRGEYKDKIPLNNLGRCPGYPASIWCLASQDES